MLTAMQLEFARNARLHRWNVKSGATGSGKTFMDVLYQIPRRIMDCHGEGLIVLLGNTRSTLARNVLDPMRSIWGEKLVGSIRADGTVTLLCTGSLQTTAATLVETDDGWRIVSNLEVSEETAR